MTKEERRVGYWGRDTMAVGAALAGILHLEAEPRSFTALCNGKSFDYCTAMSRIFTDMAIRRLRICKRCEMKEAS